MGNLAIANVSLVPIHGFCLREKNCETTQVFMLWVKIISALFITVAKLCAVIFLKIWSYASFWSGFSLGRANTWYYLGWKKKWFLSNVF